MRSDSCICPLRVRSCILPAPERAARLWDGRTGKLLGALGTDEGISLIAGFSPDGRRIASGAADSTMRLWDVRSGEPTLLIKGRPGGSFFTPLYSPDGERLLLRSDDATAQILTVGVRSVLTAACEILRDQPAYEQVRSDCRPYLPAEPGH